MVRRPSLKRVHARFSTRYSEAVSNHLGDPDPSLMVRDAGLRPALTMRVQVVFFHMLCHNPALSPTG
jgi:hypothetical protein